MVKEKVLESLYVVNKKAKYYSEESRISYQMGQGGFAKLYSLKKDALYDIKYKVLNEIICESKDIRIDLINGCRHYAVFFDGMSFHIPYDKADLDCYIEDEDTFCEIEYEADSEIKEEVTDLDLPISLAILENEFGFEANNFLSDRKINCRNYEVRKPYFDVAENTMLSDLQ